MSLQDQGEFLIKVDAHQDHYRGRLSPGYSEMGFVKDQELAKYLVNFKVWENQEINFTVKLQVISGNAELHVKRCKIGRFCDYTADELKDKESVMKNNNEFEKELKTTCKEDSCDFLIVVMGLENHGTHFEILVQENKFHYLMIPGHSITINLVAGQQKYLKFSNPNSSQRDNLYMQVDPYWGSFELFLDK